jgi:hypothetical protein
MISARLKYLCMFCIIQTNKKNVKIVSIQKCYSYSKLIMHIKIGVLYKPSIIVFLTDVVVQAEVPNDSRLRRFGLGCSMQRM